MSNLVEVLKVTDLTSGQMKAMEVGGKEILIAQVDDKYYAVSNVCPHRGGKLSNGKLDDTIVECPVHGSRFNLTNGQVIRRLNGGFTGKLLGLLKVISRIKTYRIAIEGDSIKLEV